MTTNSHIIRTEEGDVFIGWCGYQQRSNFRFTKRPDRSDICPKCSAKYYTDKISNDFAYHLGDRIPQPTFSDYKSVYPIIDKSDESMRGFVVIKNGWGKSWSVRAMECSVTLRNAKDSAIPEPTMERDDVRYMKKIGDDEFNRTASGNSKEEALFLVPTLIAQGKLPSRKELEATALDQITEWNKTIASREARQAQQAEDLVLIAEEFASLLAGTLTNRQHTAILMAAKKLGIEVPS